MTKLNPYLTLNGIPGDLIDRFGNRWMIVCENTK
jgi:hypothetical protein